MRLLLRGTALWLGVWTCLACDPKIVANNAYDPNASVERKPGRISGTLYVAGVDQADQILHVVDGLGVEIALLHSDADGAFLSAELVAGTYSLFADVPVQNLPVQKNGIEVLPGVTTDVGLLVSGTAPPIGQINGLVALENSTLSPNGVRVIASLHAGTSSQTWVQYSDSAGNYSFSQLPAGDYEIRADKESFTPDFGAVQIASNLGKAPASPPVLHLYPASAVVRFSVPTALGSALGAAYSQTRNVDVVLLAFGGVNQMRLSESPDLNEGGGEVAWRDYVAQAPVVLSAGEGTKRIYAQFRRVAEDDSEKLRSDVYGTQLILDQSPPVVSRFVLSPNSPAKNNVRYLVDPANAVPVHVEAFDAYSTVAGIKFLIEGQGAAGVAYTSLSTQNPSIVHQSLVTLSLGDGAKSVEVRLIDGAGNESVLSSDVVVVDTTPPVNLASPASALSASPRLGAQLTSTTLTLDFAVGGDELAGIDGPVRMLFGVGSQPPTNGVFVAFQPNVALQISASDGDPVDLYAVFEDNAGNQLVQTASYQMNLHGNLSGKVYLEGVADNALGHDGTQVDVFAASVDPNTASAVQTTVTVPDGSYSFAQPFLAGTYQVRFLRTGAVTAIQSPVTILAAQDTTLGLQRLTLARGNLIGTFLMADLAPSANHSGILVQAWKGNTLVASSITDAGGQAVLTNVPAGPSYEIRVSKSGYLPRTLVGINVLADTDNYINAQPEYLAKLSGDFTLCKGSDAAPLPKNCTPIAYLNEASVLLGLQADSANATHVRYVIDTSGTNNENAFADPSSTPLSDLCASPPASECWNPYATSNRYTLDVSAMEGPVTIVVQFANSGATQPASAVAVVRDTQVPQSPAINIAPGASAALAGITNTTSLELTLTASQGGATGVVAPLQQVLVSRDATWGNGDDVTFSYGGGSKIFPIDAVNGSKTIRARFQDEAGNITAVAAAVTASIVLDTQAPTTANGATLVPSGAGITDKLVASRQWWSRGTSYGLQLGMGSSGYQVGSYTVPEVVAFQVSLSPQFVGGDWVPLDVPTLPAGSSVSVSGVPLLPVDGAHVVYARFRDAAGNVTTDTAALQMTLFLDTTPPGGSVLLAGGANYTNIVTPATIVALLSTDVSGGAHWVQSSWTGSLPDPNDLPSRQLYAVSLPVAVPAGDGVKTLLVRFIDDAGNYAERQDTINLDTVAPQSSASSSCSSCVSGYTNSATGAIALALFANDDSGQIAAIDVSIDGGVVTSYNYAPSLNVSIPANNAAHTVAVSYRDPAGNTRITPTLTITHDGQVPTGASVVINSAAAYSNDRAVFLDLSAADSGSGVVDMAVANGSIDCASASYEQYATSRAWTLPVGDVSHSVWACFRDLAGNTTSTSSSIILDQTAPTGVSISLAGGQSYSTTATNVSVALAASDNLTSGANLKMQISEDPTFAGLAAWSNFATSTTVNLSSGNGSKTVYVRVRDLAGNISAASDGIILDSDVPTLSALSLYNTTTGSSTITNSLSARLLITATGADEMRISGALTNVFVNQWITAASQVDLTLDNALGNGVKTITVQLRDTAGNASNPSSRDVSITLDQGAPSAPSIIVNQGVSYTNSQSVWLDLSAGDVDSQVVDMAIANTSISCASANYEQYVTGRAWTLPVGDTTQTVWVCFRDLAGNTTSVSDDIILDQAAPNSVAITMAAGATYSNTFLVSATTIGGADNLTSVANLEMQISDDPTFSNLSSWSTFSTSGSVTFSGADGNKTAYLRVRDRAGNITQANDSIILDRTPPILTAVTIGGGAAYLAADSSDVAIAAVDSTSGLYQMYLSRNGVFNDGAWENFSTSKNPWDLNGGAGNISETRFVYVQVRDNAGNISSSLSDTVILDFNNPVVSSVVIAAGAATTSSTGVNVTVTASDTAPGVLAQMQLSEDPAFDGANWESWVPSRAFVLSSTNGAKTVYVKVRDAAARESSALNDTIVLDTIAPTGISLSVASGAYTSSSSVTLNLTGYDNVASGANLTIALANTLPTCSSATYSYNFSGCTGTPCTKSISGYALSTGDGAKTVYACIKDTAGLVTQTPLSANVFLDSVAPPSVSNLNAAAQNRQATLSWATTYDNSGGSGVQSYQIDYSKDQTFSVGTVSVSVLGSLTTAEISGLDNRIPYYFRVSAIDYAGRQGLYSLTKNAVLGIGTARLEPAFSNRAASVPRIYISQGRTWITAINVTAGDAGVDLYYCDINRNDCRVPTNWLRVGGGSPSLALPSSSYSVTYNQAQITGTPDRIYVATLAWTGSSATTRAQIWSCPRMSGCSTSASWTAAMEVDTPTAADNVENSHIGLTSNGQRIFATFHRSAAGVYYPETISCPQNLDCTVAGNWTHASPTTYNSYAVVGADYSSVSSDLAFWTATRSTSIPPYSILVNYCPTDSLCDAASDFTQYRLNYPTGGSTQTSPTLVRTLAYLYMTINESTSSGVQRIARCALSTSCNADTDWSPFGLFLSSADIDELYLPVRLAYSNQALHALWRQNDTEAVNYAVCNKPDTVDCTVPSNWVRMTLDATGLATTPDFAFYGAGFVAVYLDENNYFKLKMPQFVPPADFSAAPGLGEIRISWSPMPVIDGYTGYYDIDAGDPWGSSVILPDSLTPKSVISAAAGADNYTTLQVDLDGQYSDYTRTLLVRPLRAATPITSSLNYWSPCPGFSTDDCGVYSTAIAGTRLVSSYKDSTGNFVATCNDSPVGNCGNGANWVNAQTPLSNSVYGQSVAASGSRIFAAGDYSGGSLRFSYCDLSSNCDAAGDWKAELIVNSNISPLPPALVLNGSGTARIYALTRQATTNYLTANYCAVGGACETAAGWNTAGAAGGAYDVTINATASTMGFSAAGGSSLIIAREYADHIERGYCVYSNWTSATSGTGSCAYGTVRTLAPLLNSTRLATDGTNNNSYLITAAGGTVFVGYCPYNTINFCNSGERWVMLPITNYDGSMPLITDITVAGGQIYAVAGTLNELRLATCSSDCFERDNWSVSTIIRDPFMLENYRNNRILGTSGGKIGFGYMITPSSGSSRHTFGWDGQATILP